MIGIEHAMKIRFRIIRSARRDRPRNSGLSMLKRLRMLVHSLSHLLKESILFFQTKSNVNLIYKKPFKGQIRILKMGKAEQTADIVYFYEKTPQLCIFFTFHKLTSLRSIRYNKKMRILGIIYPVSRLLVYFMTYITVEGGRLCCTIRYLPV